MILQHATWPEVEQHLQRSSAVVIPIGSTEQHGPTGLIGTDAICAQTVAQTASERAENMLVAPTLALTSAQFNLDFPGTISVRTSTLMAVITDVVDSLTRSGFRKFYFLNGHGANIAAVRGACHDLHQVASLNEPDSQRAFRLRSWWEFEEANALRQSLYGEREGMHATPSEISITRSALPDLDVPTESADFAEVAASYIVDHSGDGHDDARAHRQRFPQGQVGADPMLAQREHGDRFIEAAVTGMLKDFADFLNE